MEYTQWEGGCGINIIAFAVLILVVMEYTQWGRNYFGYTAYKGLNPCCNGIYSMRMWTLFHKRIMFGLNPCCNGIYSMSLYLLLYA